MEEEEEKFRKRNKDCFIPKDFREIHYKYANLPECLRRWCSHKELIEIKKDIIKLRDMLKPIIKGLEEVSD